MYAKIRGFSAGIQPNLHDSEPSSWGLQATIRRVLIDADMKPDDLDHLNAEGNGTLLEDPFEAQAIRAELGDIPVVGLKGFFGNLGSGAGAVELLASLLAMKNGMVPATRNCDRIAPDCPIQVIQKPLPVSKKAFIKVSQTPEGRSFALIVEALS